MAWTTITSEGGLFSPDLLDELASGSGDGQREDDFGLERGRLSDEIQAAFSDAQSYWDSFQRRLERNTEDQHTGITRQAWMIPFFGLLGYREGDLVFQRGSRTVGDVEYPISFFAGTDEHAPPIHIVGRQYSLDRRPPQGGRSPHALVQEYLNRDEALWGVTTNGYRLRLLRDSQRMTRPTYLEFDLEGMITGSQYSEFALLYRIMHRTRFPRGSDDAHTCFLERWFQQGIEQGGRVREKLRNGVEAALEGLGRSFLQHPESAELRSDLARGRLSAHNFERELLRLIYRLLFLMVAEERRLLFSGEPTEEQRTYERYYSVSQLRERAALPQMRNRESRRHSDLWQGLLTTFRLFRIEELAQRLGLHALNGELFGESACRRLESARVSNHDLLRAIDSLGRFDDEKVRRRVNYAALDVEELGSVYESLLDFEPIVVDADPERPEIWDFQLGAGGGRKSSGSYYTPRELVQELIGSALVPVMEQRLKDAGRDPQQQEKALLSMTVIDPAAGSGHFLLAAARRIARELAKVRTGEGEPAPEAVREAMRDVVPSCIYGVDKNPMAVDLCKVALWIEGHAPGRPLSFLDHHIKHGDSLIGVYDLQVLQDGIPDGAYKALTGDDKAVATAARKRNRDVRKQKMLWEQNTGGLAAEFSDLRSLPDSTTEDVEEKAQIYESLRSQDTKWWDLKVACDLWTYAFFVPLTQESWIPTSYDVRQSAQKSGANPKLEGDAIAASEEHPYFHWPLEFPDVLDEGGFDVVLGNPPWERARLEEKEFFAGRDAAIAEASDEARKRLIRLLKTENPVLAEEFERAKQHAQAESSFAHGSERYPLSGIGQVNFYQLFSELAKDLGTSSGRAGLIVPTGIATDFSTRKLFANFVSNGSISRLIDYENSEAIFPSVHRSYKFCLISLGSDRRSSSFYGQFWLSETRQMDSEESMVRLTKHDVLLVNPNTGNAPLPRNVRDLNLLRAAYERVPVLESESDRGALSRHSSVRKMPQSGSRSPFVDPVDSEDWIPRYSGGMFHQYDHRFAMPVGNDPKPVPTVDSWKEVPTNLVRKPKGASRSRLTKSISELSPGEWFLVWRHVARSTDSRTVIASILPISGIEGSSTVVTGLLSAADASCVLANMNAFAFDFLARQKSGGPNVEGYIMKQLPLPQPERFAIPSPWRPATILRDWIADRVLELSYTAWNLQPFAQDLGYDGPPFKWDPERRFEIRGELDAAYFHLYEIERDDVDYIMSTFPIVQRKDEAAHGTYRTRDRILEIYDAMASGEWQSSLDPPVADQRAAHPAEEDVEVD
ncbi:MAG: N-6 DNA methylase [Chloroflexi bacterium]|nr:N-6 DNA methylase [Chloroflexota bacterium]